MLQHPKEWWMTYLKVTVIDQHFLKCVFTLLQSLSQKLKNPCKYLEFTRKICLVVLFIKTLAQ